MGLTGRSVRSLVFAGGTQVASRGVQMTSYRTRKVLGGTPVMTIAELRDWFAQDCMRAAGLTEEKKQREMLLKLAEEWLAVGEGKAIDHELFAAAFAAAAVVAASQARSR